MTDFHHGLLVLNDTNGAGDIFLRDRALSQTVRISLSANGSEANANSAFPSISADARFIAFQSGASNLVPGDTNGWSDVFVVDRQAATIERVSINDLGVQGNDGSFGPSISDNGRWICFRTSSTNMALGDADMHENIFLHDRRAKSTRKMDRSPAGAHPDDFALETQLSGDGFSVTYASLAKNILPGASNNWVDVFVVRHQELSPAVYCTGTANSQGCVPSMSWSGAPSVNASNNFTLSTTQLLPNRPALFVYGVSGPASLPLHGTTQCVNAPLFRTPLQSSGGAAVCSGSVSIDFNSFAASGTHPLLIAGRSVWVQCWSRDPQASSTQSLSDAVFFVLEP